MISREGRLCVSNNSEASSPSTKRRPLPQPLRRFTLPNRRSTGIWSNWKRSWTDRFSPARHDALRLRRRGICSTKKPARRSCLSTRGSRSVKPVSYTHLNQQLANARAQLDALTAENESYTELSQEYSKYVVTGLTEEEMDLSDRNELIDLLSDTVMRATYLSSVKVVGNSVAVTCVGVGLQDVSGLVQELEQDERVAYVTVSTAQEKDCLLYTSRCV